jgi:phosphoribosylformylglycinamidine synthase
MPENEFDIDSLRDTWYKTSYLLDRDQSMNGMAKKRYTNYKKQPIEMKFTTKISRVHLQVTVSILIAESQQE